MTPPVLFELPRDPQLPMCRRIGCGRAGTSTTELVGRGRTWELHHCEEHADDGPQIAAALGFGGAEQLHAVPADPNVVTMLELPEAS